MNATFVDKSQPEFFDGKVLSWREFGGLAIGDVFYKVGSERPRHSHKRACFHYLLEGGYVDRQGTRLIECNPMSVSFQPLGLEHSYRIAGTTASRSVTIELEENWISRLREHSVVLDSPINFQGGTALWLMTRLYNEFRSMQTGSLLAIEALTIEIAVETSRRKRDISEKSPPRWLGRAIDLLNDRFAESISLTEIASEVGVHPVHLARTFRQFQHCTVGEYLRRIRIEYACRRIIQSNSTLLEIALSAGFYDQSQFCRTFKNEMGTTPAEFRSGIHFEH